VAKIKYDIYNGDNEYRYCVGNGKDGKNPFYFIGRNPGNGTNIKTDKTMTIVRETVEKINKERNNDGKKPFDAYILLNVYPQRNGLNSEIDSNKHDENIKHIMKIKSGSDIWAAWGDFVGKPSYLTDCLNYILWLLKEKNIHWKSRDGKSPVAPFENKAHDLDDYELPEITNNDYNRAIINIYNYGMIVQEAKELIISINQNCKSRGKEPIYKDGLFELWREIEKLCSSKNDFEVFSSSLYKLVIEITRYENQNFEKNGGHFYEYRYSEYSNEFWKEGTITKDFTDDVKAIRHGFQHTEQKNKAPKKKRVEVLKKYLNNETEPSSPEEFQVFQIMILKEFVKFLSKLLEMIKGDPSPPKNH
jgi:hypothetical protein